MSEKLGTVLVNTKKVKNQEHGCGDLHEFGFGKKYGTRAPPCEEVKICRQWIYLFCTPRKTINTEYSSYYLKHVVERWSGRYIPNGAFIQAAIELGYSYTRKGPNAKFNMSYVRAKKDTDSSRWIPMN